MKMKPTLPVGGVQVSQWSARSYLGLEPFRDGKKKKLTLDVGKEALILGVLGDETLESTANHGVLSHQDNTLATEGDTDLVHLLGRDIVDTDDEDSVVLIEKRLQLLEVSGLGS